MLKSILIAGIATISMLASSNVYAETGPQPENFTLCNKSNEDLNVAIGYVDKDYGWMSAGWFIIGRNSCKNLLTGELNNQFYYIYAEGNKGSTWSALNDQDGGFFCIRPGKFTMHNNDYETNGLINCEADGVTTKQFRKVDTGNSPGYEFDLTPS